MFKRFLFFGIIIITFSNCSKTPYLPYHSTAGIPHDTRMVQTEMTLMNNKSNNTSGLSYGVIAAMDNEEMPYILIAPASIAGTIKRGLWDYNVSYSTTIHPEKVEELIKSLALILRKWDSNATSREGYFFEFTHTPQHRIFQNSEDVITKLPTIRVNFNLTQKGSVGSLTIGEGDLRYLYTFEEKEDVLQFGTLLKNGLNELNKMKR